jgi:hypothetical protein
MPCAIRRLLPQPFQTLCATALTSLAILFSGALVLGNGFTPPWKNAST